MNEHLELVLRKGIQLNSKLNSAWSKKDFLFLSSSKGKFRKFELFFSLFIYYVLRNLLSFFIKNKWPFKNQLTRNTYQGHPHRSAQNSLDSFFSKTLKSKCKCWNRNQSHLFRPKDIPVLRDGQSPTKNRITTSEKEQELSRWRCNQFQHRVFLELCRKK